MIRWPTIYKQDDENPWVTYFKRQVHYKNNCINAAVTGLPGMGKSWGLIYLLSHADENFSTERIFFRASKMLRWIDRDGLKKKGCAFMFDEAGIDATNLNWWDEINKGLNAFFQTGRSGNYIFGMTVPFLSYISKGVRTLMNCKFNAEGWTQENLTKFRCHTLEYNGEVDKFYRKRLLVRDKTTSAYCNEIRLPKADIKLIKEYEKMKIEFKKNLYSGIAKKLERFEEATWTLTHYQKKWYEYRTDHTLDESIKEFKIGMRSGYDLDERCKKKGFEIAKKRLHPGYILKE